MLDALTYADSNGVALEDRPYGAEVEACLEDKLLDTLALLSVMICCRKVEAASESWHTCDAAEADIGRPPCYFRKQDQMGPC